MVGGPAASTDQYMYETNLLLLTFSLLADAALSRLWISQYIRCILGVSCDGVRGLGSLCNCLRIWR